MLIACPHCGNPVCSDCGNHVSSGAVGVPTIQRIVAPIQQSGFTRIPIVTWDSVKPGTNETYVNYYSVVVWAYASNMFLQRTGHHWPKTVEWVKSVLREFATPLTFFSWVGPPATDAHIGQVVGTWLSNTGSGPTDQTMTF